MIQNVRSSIHNQLHWLVLLPMLLLASCAGSDSEEAHNTPVLSDIPVSFTALSKWDDAKTRLQENSDNSVSFEKDDKIGIFAYYNNSETPNFMNNQLATCNTATDGSTSWAYTPIKYWPSNENDQLSFYAYYPYKASEDKTLSVSSPSSATPLTIEYNCPNADIDLMVEKTENLKYQNEGKVPLCFKHLLARVRFTFTYKKNDDKDDYRPVIHVLKYTIPYYQGSLIPYAKNQESDIPSRNWKIGKNTDTAEIKRIVTDAAGIVLHENNQLIDEFTAYLLPCSFPFSSKGSNVAGSFNISLNNKFYTYTPTQKITVKAGESYTINFIIKNNTSSTNEDYFITSYSIWKDGGTINGTLE